MTRSRLDWFASAVLIAALAGCGSSSSPDESESSHAAASGEASDDDAGPSDSSGSTKTGSTSTSDAGSATGSNADDTKSDDSDKDKDKDKDSDDDDSTADQSTTNSGDLPTDGNQLSLCSMAQGDCNKGFACSGSASAQAESRNYCSKICETDDDCAGLTPSSASYTCSSGRGITLCQIACSGSEDASCPENMQCVVSGVERAANGGSGGSAFVPVYHCKYPLITSPLWGPCQDGEHQCAEDARCHRSEPGGPGVCTKACTQDSDCSEEPSSGSITPSCATIASGRGNMMETKLCVLSCLDNKDGCPDGTTCVDGPPAPMTRSGRAGRSNMGGDQAMSDAGLGRASQLLYARCE